MTTISWLPILPPLFAIALAMWSKRIIPTLLAGLLLGGYLLDQRLTGGVVTAVDQIVGTLTDKDSLQVLLFLYLLSGLMGIIKRSGGIDAFSALAGSHVASKKGVFSVMGALIPVTFIDCGFRFVGAGSITRPLAEKHEIARERPAFMLNNTASPVVGLIPIATTFVGFNLSIITIGLKNASIMDQTTAYATWLRALPLDFFSLVVIAMTFFSMFRSSGTETTAPAAPASQTPGPTPSMAMADTTPMITPRLVNPVVPMLTGIVLSIFCFWRFGSEGSPDSSVLGAIANTEPHRAMPVALFIAIFTATIVYAFQKYGIKEMVPDFTSGGNEIMPTLMILAVAWPLASVWQELGMNTFIEQLVGSSLPQRSVAVTLFLLSAATTYFIGSGWGPRRSSCHSPFPWPSRWVPASPSALPPSSPAALSGTSRHRSRG